MKTIKLVSAAAVFAGGLFAVNARAAESGVYVGGGLGVGRYQDNVNGVSGSDVRPAGKLFGGYQINPYVGLEAGFADLSKVDNSTGRISGRAEYVDAVGTLPVIDRFALLGSLGFAHVNLDTSNGDGGGNGLKLGLGAQYSLTDNVSFRAQAERYHAEAFGTRPDIDQYTVAVKYKF